LTVSAPPAGAVESSVTSKFELEERPERLVALALCVPVVVAVAV
jgi:hypothetical protein